MPDIHPVDVYVGAMIRKRRKELGLSQQGLAEALGITFQQVQKYESGFNRISASKLFQTSRTLQVPITYFYEGKPEVGIEAASPSEQTVTAFGLSAEGIELAQYYPKLSKISRRSINAVVRAMLHDQDARNGADAQD